MTTIPHLSENRECNYLIALVVLVKVFYSKNIKIKVYPKIIIQYF